jgi:hypothetical protein
MAIGFKTGKAALALNPKPGFGFTSAANPEMLPKPKPRAVPEHFVVPPIRSRKVACAQQSRVWHREDALQPLDLSNALLGVHTSQYLTERQGGQFGAASGSGTV